MDRQYWKHNQKKPDVLPQLFNDNKLCVLVCDCVSVLVCCGKMVKYCEKNPPLFLLSLRETEYAFVFKVFLTPTLPACRIAVSFCGRPRLMI